MGMNLIMANCFATVAVLLITYETIFQVKGQCTVPGCDYGDSSISIVTEIQQLKVELFDQLNKQVQSLHEILCESLQEMKTDIHVVNMSLQSVDRRFQQQGHNIQVLLNKSFQQMTNQHDSLFINLQAHDRQRAQEHDVCINLSQSIHQLVNKSFLQMTGQSDMTMRSLREVDERLQEHDIAIKNKSHNAWKLSNEIFDPDAQVRDCSDIKASGQTASGVYDVCVGHQLDRICTSAYCDMQTANGASLVFQRRRYGNDKFNRTWAEYKRGFGSRHGDFWLGNEMLHRLTSKRNYRLRIDLEDFHQNMSFAEYTQFSISSSADNYRLSVSGYSGNAGDSLSGHNGLRFTTYDVDNDDDNDGEGEDNCGIKYGGGWWFRNCFSANLNGLYFHQYNSGSGLPMGIVWVNWRGYYYTLKATEMKLVPRF